MKVIADLHIHSKYSRATSNKMDIETISQQAKIKGLGIIGTGDFTHPKWFEELKSKLVKEGDIYMHNGIGFMPQTEISSIYTDGGKVRKVHNCIMCPDLETAEQVTEWLKTKGRVDYDGRPIFKLPCPELVEKVMEINKQNFVFPAHIWTPWFSLFGSESGFDRIEDCYKDQTKHIHALETGLSCYDKKTEVLTDKGWKKFSDVTHSDNFCTLDIKTNKIEFQKPLRLFKYKYKGKMYKLKTKRIDLLVTPNHKLLYSKCDFRKKPSFSLKEAELLFKKSKRFKKDGIWIGQAQDFFILPSVKIKHGSRHYSGFRSKSEKRLPIIPWMKFFGFWIAEGWTTEGKNGDYNVCVSNTDEKLIFEMKQLLEGFGYSTLYNKKTYTLRVRDFQLFNYLKQFGKCYNKFIPLDIKLLSKELLKILLDYYIKGDGHIYGRTKKGLSATTTSIKLRDDLQEIALKVGMSAYYKLHKKKGTPFHSPGQGKIYKQRNDSWVIYFIRRNIHAVLPSTIKKWGYTESWVNFDDYVFCISVPNKVVYVRRNGIPVWCGNSDPSMNWRLSQLDRFTLISNSDCHSPWPYRLGREANVFELSKLSYKEMIEAIKSKDPKRFLYTIEVDPAYGRYHFDGHRAHNVEMSPEDAIKHNNICPVCKAKMTLGVLHRVEELADRPAGFVPKHAIPFKKILPLQEIIATVNGSQVFSVAVTRIFNNLISHFGTEMNILLDASFEQLKAASDENAAKAILLNRENKISVKPGYDGVYGVPSFGEEIKVKKRRQSSLSEF